ncbi:MAG TPA: LPS assembly lipoprotein LptE [Turneriella sp.]|nr:LPS assembly lipoprotein LptE [Turneriella sp.]
MKVQLASTQFWKHINSVCKIFRKIYPAFLVYLAACASLAQGNGTVNSQPLTDAYKNYRSQKKHSLYIQNFDNRTYAPQLTGRLKAKLQIALASSASLYITDDKNNADLVLYGKILLYGEEPTQFSAMNQAPAFNLVIAASIKLRARVEEKAAQEEILYEQHDIQFSTMYNTGDPYFETRFTAEERLLDGLANRIANIIFDPKVKP